MATLSCITGTADFAVLHILRFLHCSYLEQLFLHAHVRVLVSGKSPRGARGCMLPTHTSSRHTWHLVYQLLQHAMPDSRRTCTHAPWSQSFCAGHFLGKLQLCYCIYAQVSLQDGAWVLFCQQWAPFVAFLLLVIPSSDITLARSMRHASPSSLQHASTTCRGASRVLLHRGVVPGQDAAG